MVGWLDGSLSNLNLWKMALPVEWGLGYMVFVGSCQPKPFHDSMHFLCFPSRPDCIQFWAIFLWEAQKRHNDPRQLLWSKSKLLLQGNYGPSHKMHYMYPLFPRVFKRARCLLLKFPNYKTQGFPFSFCFLSLSRLFFLPFPNYLSKLLKQGTSVQTSSPCFIQSALWYDFKIFICIVYLS